jgi:3,4-dihydroxy 2-butanone 4-phosphate synthase/GTP cyclohydrolase II
MINDDGSMMDAADWRAFCDEHDLVLCSIADLIRYRLSTEKLVTKVAETKVPLDVGEFRAVGYPNNVDASEHVALCTGDSGNGEDVPVRVHAKCVYGDPFGSLLCQCRSWLDASPHMIADEGRGVLVYVRPQAGGSSPVKA